MDKDEALWVINRGRLGRRLRAGGPGSRGWCRPGPRTGTSSAMAKERKKKEIGRPAEQTGGVSFGEHSRNVEDGRNPDGTPTVGGAEA